MIVTLTGTFKTVFIVTFLSRFYAKAHVGNENNASCIDSFHHVQVVSEPFIDIGCFPFGRIFEDNYYHLLVSCSKKRVVFLLLR